MKIYNFIFILTSAFCSGQNSDVALETLGDKLFSSVCTADTQYSDWSGCIWPHGDLRRVVDTFLKDASDKGCKVPPRPMIREALNEIGKANISAHPLYRMIPQHPCGFCSRKAKCCKNSRSVLMQSFKNEHCEITSPPCTFAKIDDGLVARLRHHYPEVTFNGDRCNFTQYTSNNMQKLKAEKAFKAVKPLMCQLLGTSDPKINCVSFENACKCCCHEYIYQNGECVLQADHSSSGC